MLGARYPAVEQAHDFEVDVRHGHVRDPTTVTYSTVTSLAHVGQSAALRVGADVT